MAKPKVVRVVPGGDGKAAPPQAGRCIRKVKYEFQPSEKIVLGDQLAAEIRGAINDAKAKETEMARFATLRKDHEERCGDLSLKLAQGYEYRECECVAQYSTPRPGVKTIVRADNGAFVAEEAMTDAEMQGQLFSGTTDETKAVQ